MESYSVLMSVYNKENANFLRESMESIYNQSIPTNDFVLVCDGPLGKDLIEVIKEMKEKFGPILNVLPLDKNVGLGKALEVGIEKCKNDLVARMDSDDIARPDRCKKELEAFRKDKELSIVSGTVEEFVGDPKNVYACRILPECHEDILKFAKFRCPFNHPCVMYRKSAVEAAGGYQSFYLLEDYYLWVRMLLNGSKGRNLQESLLWMRAGNDLYKRRGGWRYAKSQAALIYYMRKRRFISSFQYYILIVVRVGAALLPNAIRKYLYENNLRKGISDGHEQGTKRA